MKDIVYQEIETKNKKGKIAILEYTGSGDPEIALNEAVRLYSKHEQYNEFIDANVNPFIRVIIKGINEMELSEFNPTVPQ